MNGEQHYLAAERCLQDANDLLTKHEGELYAVVAPAVDALRLQAQVHATLALAAATAGRLNSWVFQ